ncbi:hypothetical protein ECG_09313 [Echinococcus granulosus]|uniref:Expressed conserved protein n=1 Tax=Echinococcus granulosus TaxID=6210 RepID=A0A068WU79_ECHGR|nr:hypothetical protein ECG_09313 [Echinococcus granulosus]CDS23344.1 expressed conserved protein [Echinococcus granulosus]
MIATKEASNSSSVEMDHVVSVPVDLREMSAIRQMPNQSMHRTAGVMSLNASGLDGSENRVFEGADEPKEYSDEVNTSELAQDVELLYELIDEKNAETKELKRDLKALRESCNELQGNLEEAQMIISEQQEQLDIYRQEVAVSKSNIEALKLRNFILASNSKGATDEIRKMVEEYHEMQEELERLRRERKTTEAEMTRLRKQGSFLRKRVDDARTSQGNGTSSVGDERSGTGSTCSHSPVQDTSSDAAELIRKLRTERQNWEEYANRLVRAMVENGRSPNDLLEAQEDTATMATAKDAERWRTYAIRLLSDVVSTDPSRLTEFDLRLLRQHTFKDEEYEASQSKVTSSGLDTSSCEVVAAQTTSSVSAAASTERPTRVNFAQTRRRKIDRLKEFFQRRGRH